MIELSKIFYAPSSNKIFQKNNKFILTDISFRIPHGEILGIIGESGAGKTTIGKIVAGIIKPSAGVINYNSVKQEEIQFLFQNSSELVNPYRKVESLLADTTNGEEEKIHKLIENVNLEKSILHKYAFQLSGGERQRIALARILATSPKLLIIDEPFSAQDYDSQVNLMELFVGLNHKSNLTILCISHDLEIMKKFPRNLIVMRDGKIIESGLTTEIVSAPKHKYTKFLFKASNYKLTPEDFDDIK